MIALAAVAWYYEEDFSHHVVTGPGLRYHDNGGHKCVHKLENWVHGSMSHRAVAQEGHISTGRAHISHNMDETWPGAQGNELGFETYFVDTLGADGSAALHAHGSAGAEVGVMSGNETSHGLFGHNAYEIKATGIDGLVAVCTMPLVLEQTTALTAHATIYVGQAGWHELADEVRVWAEVAGMGGGGAYSLLPNCAVAATRDNIDTLGLRRTSPAASDPSTLPDEYTFQRLSTSLGTHGRMGDSVRVCASLQSGAGHEALYIASLALSLTPLNATTAAAAAHPDPDCPELRLATSANFRQLGARPSHRTRERIHAIDAALLTRLTDRTRERTHAIDLLYTLWTLLHSRPMFDRTPH